jgi:Na+-transporting methylmalonyl-CoA/oxaloacetate decarboxylase gamma subunit
LYGLDAISDNNGWYIAAAGIGIVFAGLIVLSLVIAQLHRLVALIDSVTRKPAVIPEAKPDIRIPPADPYDIDNTVKVYSSLVEELSPEFQLSELYALAKEYHLPHPHLSIRCLLETGKLQPLGDGVFVFIP